MSLLSRIRAFFTAPNWDDGYAWAMEEIKKGTPLEKIEAQTDCVMCGSDFDCGVMHAVYAYRSVTEAAATTGLETSL